MPLWGAVEGSESLPKFLTTAQQKDVYANQSGWVVEAGSAMTGNGNTSADPEILVAIGGLAGVSATTGLKTATITSFRFNFSTGATTDGTAHASGIVSVQITWDEAITVTGSPTVIVANDTNTDHTCVYASGTGTNRLVFTQASGSTMAADDVLTIGGANISLAGGTLKDQGATPADASQDMGNVTAVTHTVTA